VGDWLLRRANVGCVVYAVFCGVLWQNVDTQPTHFATVFVAIIAVGALGFGSQKLRLSGRVFAAAQYPFHTHLFFSFFFAPYRRQLMCVRAINLSLVIIVLIVSDSIFFLGH